VGTTSPTTKFTVKVRNKIPTHEEWKYTYVFDHFDEYCNDIAERRTRIDRINEMERWLNTSIQQAIANCDNVKVLNPFGSVICHEVSEAKKRAAFRTAEARQKLDAIVEKVKHVLGVQIASNAPHSKDEDASG
jgi:hypothetical protein